MTTDKSHCPVLQLQSAIGFQGSIVGGLKMHPSGETIFYAIGNTLVSERIDTRHQYFYHDPDRDFCDYHGVIITCLDISPDGTFVATGSKNKTKSLATVSVWKMPEGTLHVKYYRHKVEVLAIAFNSMSTFLYTLGGPEDLMLSVYDVQNKKEGCLIESQRKIAGMTTILRPSHCQPTLLLSGGRDNLRVWEMDEDTSQMNPNDIVLTKLKRHINCIAISYDETLAYAGTTSGDIIVFQTKDSKHVATLFMDRPFEGGVTQIGIHPETMDMALGTGYGMFQVVTANFQFTNVRKNLEDRITSLEIVFRDYKATNLIIVGTIKCNIYIIDLSGPAKCTLYKSCHYDAINDLDFPKATSLLLATASKEEVRIWNLSKCHEVLKLIVPNMTCNAVRISPDGKSIVTGWSDCRIRAYFPESGKCQYLIDSCYGEEVTCLAISCDGSKVVSGSDMGHVVVWNIPDLYVNNRSYIFDHVLLKYHKGHVSSVIVREVHTLNQETGKYEEVEEVLSISKDGTFIVWDLVKKQPRVYIKTREILFKTMDVHPIIPDTVAAAGTSGKMAYFDVLEGIQLFMIDDCRSSCTINDLKFHPLGKYIATGDESKSVKIWSYNSGRVLIREWLHTTNVTKVTFSPDGNKLISTAKDGSIFIWVFYAPCSPPDQNPCGEPIPFDPCEAVCPDYCEENKKEEKEEEIKKEKKWKKATGYFGELGPGYKLKDDDEEEARMLEMLRKLEEDEDKLANDEEENKDEQQTPQDQIPQTPDQPKEQTPKSSDQPKEQTPKSSDQPKEQTPQTPDQPKDQTPTPKPPENQNPNPSPK